MNEEKNDFDILIKTKKIRSREKKIFFFFLLTYCNCNQQINMSKENRTLALLLNQSKFNNHLFIDWLMDVTCRYSVEHIRMYTSISI